MEWHKFFFLSSFRLTFSFLILSLCTTQNEALNSTSILLYKKFTFISFWRQIFYCVQTPPPLPSVKIGEAPLLRFLLRGGSGGCTQATNSWWFAAKRRQRVARHREKLKTVLLGSFIKLCTRSRQEVNFQEVTFRRPWHKIGDYPKKLMLNL